MGVKVTNNAYGTLSAGIASGDTTITLDGGQGARFPTLGAGDYFYGTLVDTSNNIEVVKVTARSTDSMTVVRGQDNTTARAYVIGDRFELRPTAALFNDIALGAELVNDTTPQLGGDLDLNGNDITGTGKAQINGTVSVDTTQEPKQGSFQVGEFDSSYATSGFDRIQASVVVPNQKINSTQHFSDDLDFTGLTTNQDVHWGWVFARGGDERRAGVSYDVKGREQFNIWSSYGYIQFLIRSAAAADDEPYGANMVEALRIANDGLVHPQKGLKPTFESAWVNTGQGINQLVAHGLGRTPYLVRLFATVNPNGNYPRLCCGDLGNFGSASGSDYGITSAVDDTYVAFAIGEGGISPDWGSAANNGFPTNVNALGTYVSNGYNGTGNDFLDTPTETGGGVWASAYIKVYAW